MGIFDDNADNGSSDHAAYTGFDVSQDPQERLQSFISRTPLSRMGRRRKESRTGRRQRAISLAVVFSLLAFVSFYFGGCVATLLTPDFSDPGFGARAAFRAVFTSRVGIASAVVMFALFGGLAALVLVRGRIGESEDDVAFNYAERGTYGTSSLLTSREYAEFLTLTDSAEETDGIIVGQDPATGKVVSIPSDCPLNRNIGVCGSQGSLKSVAFARNIIIQCAIRGESILCTDPKAELYGDSAFYLREKGYEVYQWNLVNRWNSDGLDILKQIHGDEEMEYVDILCHTIIANTADEKSAGDFFDKIEEVLLKALVLFVVEHLPDSKKTLAEVYNMLLDNTADDLDAMFGALKSGDPAKGAYNLFSQSPTNKGNAILGLGARMQIFQNRAICAFTGADEIDIEGLAKRKMAIFCIVSDRDATYNVLNALFISLVFIKIMAYADRQPSRKCDVPVQILLDELPNIGEIDGLKQREGTARSRDIGMTLMFQNIPQMNSRFPHGGYKELLGGCDFNMVLGCNETETSKYYEELTGTSTIQVSTLQRPAGSSSIMLSDTGGVRESAGEGKRSTVMEDEIRRLDLDELLLFVHGQKPIKLKKFPYYKHPEALKMRQIGATSVRPGWRVTPDGIDQKTGDVPGAATEKTLDEMCDIVRRDPDTLVVRDSERYGPQRTALMEEYRSMQDRYRSALTFPNGQPVGEVAPPALQRDMAAPHPARDCSASDAAPQWHARTPQGATQNAGTPVREPARQKEGESRPSAPARTVRLSRKGTYEDADIDSLFGNPDEWP